MVASAAIVALLGEFGVTVGAARTTISRLARRGVLEISRQGRYSSYRLTKEAAANLWSGGGSIAAFTAHSDSWDGFWTLIAFSIPEEHSTRRRALRTELRWRGCAPLYDGVWVSPQPLTPRGRAELSALALGMISVFRAQHLELETGADRNPVEAWDLHGIADLVLGRAELRHEQPHHVVELTPGGGRPHVRGRPFPLPLGPVRPIMPDRT